MVYEELLPFLIEDTAEDLNDEFRMYEQDQSERFLDGLETSSSTLMSPEERGVYISAAYHIDRFEDDFIPY